MTTPGLAEATIQGLCPRCGARTLFAGVVRFANRCPACGLDFASFNVGDGPAAFLTLGVGGLVTLCAVLLEVRAEPPFWVHLLLWPALTLGCVLAGLRFAKAALIATEYAQAAREGRLVKDDE